MQRPVSRRQGGVTGVDVVRPDQVVADLGPTPVPENWLGYEPFFFGLYDQEKVLSPHQAAVPG